MAETLKTEEEYLATMPPGEFHGTSVQELRDALYSLLRAYYRDWSVGAGAPAHVEGRTYYRDGNLNLMTQVMGVVRQIGEETQLPLAWNGSGALIKNGTVVFIAGAQGQRPSMSTASNLDASAGRAVAVATHDINPNSNGYYTVIGTVRDIDTSLWPEGTELFLGVNGEMTSVEPVGKATLVSIGFVTTQNPANGEVIVVIKQRHVTVNEFGILEARPLASSTTFSDMTIWSWNDEKFPAITAQAGQTDWIIEAYRDTGQRKIFFRHDQNNELHGDIQMSHRWAKTPVYLHFHTIPMAAAAGDVYWTGWFHFGAIGEELPAIASWTSVASVQAIIASDQYKKRAHGIAQCMPPASPTSSSILSIRILRSGTDPTDTYSLGKDHGTQQANLCVESYDVHYQELLVGSANEYSGDVIANPAAMEFDASYHHGSFFLRISAKSEGGEECEFRLYDITDDAVVNGTAMTSSSEYTVIELGPLTLAQSMHRYVIQGRHTGAYSEPRVSSAKFVVR